MHLLPCSEPTVRLDPAPLTTLCATPAAGSPDGRAPQAECAGFWGADDRYYLRRTAARGTEWLVGTLDAGAAAASDAAAGQPLGPALPPSLARPARLRVMLVGRQHAGRRTRVAMHVAVRRVRHA